jgi:HSP20 family protein
MTTSAQNNTGGMIPSAGTRSMLDPFSQLRGEMENLFGRYFSPAPANGANGDMLVALDVAETEKAYEFKLDVPGVKREDIDIDYVQGRLSVSGERRHEKTEEKKSYRRSERAFGAFSTSLALPADVDGDKITADLKDGVLSISVPKSDDARKQAKKISVKSG